MNRLSKMMLLLAIVVVALMGCKCFEDLEVGNDLAMQNQVNLEKNTMRSFDNLKKVGQAYAKAAGKKWTAKDEEIWSAQRKEAATQLAINYAWLLVIKEAVKQDTVDAALLGSVLEDLPGWIDQGKNIYDLVKDKFKK